LKFKNRDASHEKDLGFTPFSTPKSVSFPSGKQEMKKKIV
jgi:hypothetical protein